MPREARVPPSHLGWVRYMRENFLKANENGGVQIGRGTGDVNQTISFFAATPVAQQAAISDPAVTFGPMGSAIGSILTVLRNYGLIAAS